MHTKHEVRHFLWHVCTSILMLRRLAVYPATLLLLVYTYGNGNVVRTVDHLPCQPSSIPFDLYTTPRNRSHAVCTYDMIHLLTYLSPDLRVARASTLFLFRHMGFLVSATERIVIRNQPPCHDAHAVRAHIGKCWIWRTS